MYRDGFCMTLLLLQKRIFSSYYWEHIVTELHSQAKLASQGTVLFNQLSRERIEEDREAQDDSPLLPPPTTTMSILSSPEQATSIEQKSKLLYLINSS
jgi:hypothetical protein